MKREFKKQIIDLLNEHRIMTIATNRPDGWPQATVVGYCNDGVVIYCLISRDSQKYANIMRDPRVSLAIAKDYPQPLQIRGLSIAATAAVVTDRGETEHAAQILLHRYPEYRVMLEGKTGVEFEFEKGRQAQVVALIRTQLLKRFESSAYAFRATCEGLLQKLLAWVEVHSETAQEKRP